MTRLTVLQVIPGLDAGGSEQTALDVTRALVARGDRALVVSEGGRLEGELAMRGGELIKMGIGTKNPLLIYRNAGALCDIIRQEKVGLVHARSRAPAWSTLIAAKRARVPFVTTFHGTYNATSAPKRLYNSIMARGDTVIANSAFIARHIAQTYPWAEERTVTIPRGTDLTRFDPEAVTVERIDKVRRDWGIEGEARPIVLLAGRLTRWKGQLDFIRAFGRLFEKHGPLPLGVIVGDHQGRTDYLNELHEAIARRNLGSDILIKGHCEDMPAAMMAASVVVSASNEPEAFGRVSVEAQALGRPVIATAHGGSDELIIDVEHRRTGWLVPPGDENAMASKIEEVLALPEEYKRALAARAIDWAHAQYSVHTMTRATLNVYDALCTGS